jgi:hypothetical protein
MVKPRQVIILGLLVLIQMAVVFAVPQIEELKAQFVFPAQIQVSWKINSDIELSRLELFKDNALIYEEDLSGLKSTGLYQLGEDNKTHTFKLIVYDISNMSTSATKIRSNDKIPPEIVDPKKIISNQKTLVFTTNEPASCKAGFEANNLVEVSKEFSINHSIKLPFIEGSNKVLVLCKDEQENTMLKAATIDFMLDTIFPTKVSNILYVTKNNTTTLMWTPAADTGSGVDHYNIYTSLQQIATSTAASWDITTNDTLFYVSAVDKAGNEGDKVEYNYKRATLLAPNAEVEAESDDTVVIDINAEENTTEKGAGVSQATIIAWIIFGILVAIFTGWKVYEYKTDKHGLRRYLKQRRKMRDFEVKKRL